MLRVGFSLLSSLGLANLESLDGPDWLKTHNQSLHPRLPSTGILGIHHQIWLKPDVLGSFLKNKDLPEELKHQ